MGKTIRYFGDGHQISKVTGESSVLASPGDGWRIYLRA